jgi:hypothetical protein
MVKLQEDDMLLFSATQTDEASIAVVSEHFNTDAEILSSLSLVVLFSASGCIGSLQVSFTSTRTASLAAFEPIAIRVLRT